MNRTKIFVFAVLVLPVMTSLAQAQTQNVNIYGTVKDALILDCSRGNKEACNMYRNLKNETVVRVDNAKDALILDCSKGNEKACSLYEDMRYKEKADNARARIKRFTNDVAR